MVLVITKIFDPFDPFAFQHQLNPTSNIAAIQAAINAWNASCGADIPEVQEDQSLTFKYYAGSIIYIHFLHCPRQRGIN